MRNPHGFPIWYELLAADPDAAARFYEDTLGWRVGAAMSPDMDYRLIDTADGQVGGVIRLTPELAAGGARPGWFFYVGVDDVDATVAKVEALGGAVHLPARSIEGVGRFALLADPQGIPFYVMRGATDAASHAWQAQGMGKCGWNELTTSDQPAALAFYAEVFGWTYPDRMSMGELGDYVFIKAGGETIGAIMPRPAEAPGIAWNFYFRASDIDAAAAQVFDGSGTVLEGPMDVPGDERVLVASDPGGAMFGIVAAAKVNA